MTKLRSCKKVSFCCNLTSPLHITFRTYANLLRCAPFIPGSTLRGAIVGYLIQNYCPPEKIKYLQKCLISDIQRFHLECKSSCPVKTFFNSNQVAFSFGLFNDISLTNRNYRLITRIALDREKRAVSEGRLVSIEQIPPNTEFTFSVFLFEESGINASLIKQVVSQIGEYIGIGRFKSVGLGRFQVKEDEVCSVTLRELIQERLSCLEKVPGFGNGKLTLSLTTPLVIGKNSLLYSANTQEIGKNLAQLIYERAFEVICSPHNNSLNPIEFNEVSLKMKPEFITRYSLENNQREGRLVAWPGSSFIIKDDTFNKEALLQLAIGTILGIGEWRDLGFGCFTMEGLPYE